MENVILLLLFIFFEPVQVHNIYYISHCTSRKLPAAAGSPILDHRYSDLNSRMILLQRKTSQIHIWNSAKALVSNKWRNRSSGNLRLEQGLSQVKRNLRSRKNYFHQCNGTDDNYCKDLEKIIKLIDLKYIFIFFMFIIYFLEYLITNIHLVKDSSKGI